MLFNTHERLNFRNSDRRYSGDLTHEERLDYVNAVLCLQRLPPRTPANVSAGARSRVSTARRACDH